MFIFLLTSCESFYEKKAILDNGLYMYYNEKNKTAIVSRFDIKSFDKESEIRIPDKYEDCEITTFGYVSKNPAVPRSSFIIAFTDPKHRCSKTYGTMTVIPYRVTIYFNQYIYQMYEIDCGDYWYIEGEDTCYKIECYFVIPENNATFYSKDGNVYRKYDDSLVYKRWTLE